MKYLAFRDEDADLPMLAEVPEEDASYLRLACLDLESISMDEFRDTWIVLCQSEARSSFILDGGDIYWLFEWVPGLIVFRFDADGGVGWTALRSLMPDFAGRKATKEEMDAYDPGANNPQYNLVFTPINAETEMVSLVGDGFQPAEPDQLMAYEALVDRLQPLMEETEKLSRKKRWLEDGISRIAALTGEGKVVGGC